jgi:asparagine synthase (glutamine-hydrolysing)
MCGIAGIVSRSDLPQMRAALHTMLDAMPHRGPDARGEWHDDHCSLGHQRLAIIDLSERGNQPMQDHGGRYTLVHNGEIYNWREVRSKLDYPWKTETDTEMILAAFAHWGRDCVKHFNGMFAFAIWDNLEQSLFIARDRMGIKPVYLFEHNGVLAFASEARAIARIISQISDQRPRINKEELAGYFTYQTTYNDHTLLDKVWLLEAGFSMVWKRQQKQGGWYGPYWNVFESASEEAKGMDAAGVKKRVRGLLRESVEKRLMTDVPLGAFLSGGIDSSAVVALMSEVSDRPVDTFSVVFEEKEYDESKWAKMIADKYNTRHHPILLRPRDFLEALPDALKAMDHPSGDGINSYVVSKVTREQGITVALSGLGGDEVFAGYPIFTQLPAILQHKMWKIPYAIRQLLVHPYGWLKKGRQAEKIKALLRMFQPYFNQVYTVYRTIYRPELAFELANHHGEPRAKVYQMTSYMEAMDKLPLLSKISASEMATYTRNVLLRDTDQMSMAHALEVRVPFFDHELVEFVLGVPDELKRPTYPKKLLVESLGDLLPHDLVHRKKMGFVFPWEQWLRNDLRDFCDLRIRKLQDSGLVNPDMLGKVWQEFRQGKGEWLWTHIWLPVVLQEWMDNNGIDA